MLHDIVLHFSGHSPKYTLLVQRLPGLAMAALNLLVLICTGISELDLGAFSLGGNVAQSQLWKGALPACPHMFQAAKLTGLFSVFFNCYYSHLMIQLVFSPQPDWKQECHLYRWAYRKAWRWFLKWWYNKKRKISSFATSVLSFPV